MRALATTRHGQLPHSRIATGSRDIAHAWLADLDGDGRPDIALVATPHIGGVLRLYRFAEPRLALLAEHRGVSTHNIGSIELELGAVVRRAGRDRLLVPDQTHRSMRLLEWNGGSVVEVGAVALPGPLDGGLVATGANRWRLSAAGKAFELLAR